jgi:hypothetical protein
VCPGRVELVGGAEKNSDFHSTGCRFPYYPGDPKPVDFWGVVDMTETRAPEASSSRWAGLPWLGAAGAAALVALIMLFTPVSSDTQTPTCGFPLSRGGGTEEPAQQTDWCVAARGERVTWSLAVLTIGGFLAFAGLRRRAGHDLDARTGTGLALLALTATMLWWPQSNEKSPTSCGSALFPTSTEVFLDSPVRLAQCASTRSTMVGWALIPGAAGVLVLATRRDATRSGDSVRPWRGPTRT